MKFLGKVLFLAACVAAAQSPQTSQPGATPAAPGTDAAQLAALVKQQFGETFTLPAKFPTPIITADFDGDGVEDVAIVANSKDPLPDSYAFKYEVADPYHAYFGFGNPKISSTFRADPEHSHHVLVIFGSGKEAWHAATPKAKFVLINVPFDKLEVGRMLITRKKPPIFVIKALESEIMDSAVWWDAKKKRWKWEPGDTVQ
jgi:protein-disulfide isomerase